MAAPLGFVTYFFLLLAGFYLARKIARLVQGVCSPADHVRVKAPLMPALP